MSRLLKGFGLTLALLAVIAVTAWYTFFKGAEPSPAYRAPTACASRPEGSRWAADYTEHGSFGDSNDEWIQLVAGLEFTGERLIVYDALSSRIIELSPDLTHVNTWGREGRGPGELIPYPNLARSARVGATANGLAVFDAFAIHLFDSSRRFSGYLMKVGDTGLDTEASRIRITEEGILYDFGGYAHMNRTMRGTSPLLTVRYRTPIGHKDLLSVRTAAIPTEGPVLITRHQPKPLWDYAVGCVVAVSGYEDFVVATNLNGADVDTIPVPLSAPDPVRDSLPSFLGRGLQSKPTAPIKIRDVIIDPDGYAWLLPAAQEDGLANTRGVEIVRVSLQTGVVVHDTVPAFPTEFGVVGNYYAVVLDKSGIQRIVGYRAK